MEKQAIPRQWRSAAAATMAWLALASGAARAQTPAPQLRITIPDAWEEGRAVPVTAGRSLHIEGFVMHPEGVSRVLVNGTPAHLVADPSGVFRFDAEVVATTQARDVVVTVEPRVSKPFSRSYPLAVSEAAPAAPAPAEPPPGATPGSAPRAAAPRLLGNPWKPFTFRGLGYAVLAAGGLYLATKQSTSTSKICSGPPDSYDCVNRTVTSKPQATVGSGVAGAAVLVGVVDALLTAHRASRAEQRGEQRGEAAPSPRRVRLGAPTLEALGDGGQLALLHLTF